MLIISLLLSSLMTFQAYAIDGTYIKSDFKKIEYVTRCHQTENQKKIFQVGFKALSAVTSELKGSLFPAGNSKDTILAEMQIATTNRNRLNHFLSYIDSWVATMQDGNSSTLDLTEKAYSPRGYLVFLGGAKNFGAFKSIGASANLAVIIVPQCRTVWDKETGKIIEETLLSDASNFDFEIAINPAIGAGKKKGMSIGQSRFGVGLIFDPNHKLHAAKDFFGIGAAVSRANVLGNLAIAGKYFKSGTIINKYANYFPFVMAGKAMGVGVSQVTNWGGVSFLNITTLANVILNLTQSEAAKMQNDVREEFKKSLIELQEQQNKTNAK